MGNRSHSKDRTPIMRQSEERFMAYSGLIQWTEGLVSQCWRVKEASESMAEAFAAGNHVSSLNRLHCEAHYYVIAANKVLEYRTWAQQHGLFKNVDFSKLDKINGQAIKDLRNMREHVVEYFQGKGRAKHRWVATTPGIAADASSMVNSLIGGRLDYIEFTKIVEDILPMLRAEPIPYPTEPDDS